MKFVANCKEDVVCIGHLSLFVASEDGTTKSLTVAVQKALLAQIENNKGHLTQEQCGRLTALVSIVVEPYAQQVQRDLSLTTMFESIAQQSKSPLVLGEVIGPILKRWFSETLKRSVDFLNSHPEITRLGEHGGGENTTDSPMPLLGASLAPTDESEDVS